MSRHSPDRQPVLSVTIQDCDLQTFTCGGPGGQHQNRSRTGVRVIHEPSGAVGESREERSQLQNKKRAFTRMANSDKFKVWVRLQRGNAARLEAEVERDMAPHLLRVEGREGGRWVEIDA
jgi:protein subunit release factor B